MAIATVSIKDLQSALALNVRAISDKYEATDRALLEAGNDVLQVTTNNLHQVIIVTLPAKTESSFKILVPAKLLNDWVKSQKNSSSCTISHDEKHCLLSSSGATKIATLPIEKLPALPTFTPVATIEVEAEAFKKAIATVKASRSTDATKQVLTGIHYKTNNDSLQLLAADGHAVSMKTIPCKGDSIDAALSVEAGNGFSVNQIELSDKTARFSGQLTETVQVRQYIGVIEGNYPNINVTPQATVTCDRKQLLNQIEIACAMGAEKKRCKLYAKKEYLHIAGNYEAGDIDARIPAKNAGAIVDVTVDTAKLKKLLKSIKVESIEIGVGAFNAVNTQKKSTILTISDGDCVQGLALIDPTKEEKKMPKKSSNVHPINASETFVKVIVYRLGDVLGLSTLDASKSWAIALNPGNPLFDAKTGDILFVDLSLQTIAA